MGLKQKKMVIALGGNAILTTDASDDAQKLVVQQTAKQLTDLVKAGHKLVVTHGNGPQVGNLLLQQASADSVNNPALKLDTCVAMTEGSIGYWLQQALMNSLQEASLNAEVVCLLTQVQVAENDPAFKQPTKPIGPFFTEEEALKRATETGDHYREDAGRGWRKVVPSPQPLSIQGADVIKQLTEQGIITISTGGGGIPIVEKSGSFSGVEAVIDKDFATQKLASQIDADVLVILTGVTNVFINYQSPNEKALNRVTVEELRGHVKEHQFAAGSMLPKVEAAMTFVSGKEGREAIITTLDNLADSFENSTGTIVCA